MQDINGPTSAMRVHVREIKLYLNCHLINRHSLMISKKLGTD